MFRSISMKILIIGFSVLVYCSVEIHGQFSGKNFITSIYYFLSVSTEIKKQIHISMKYLSFCAMWFWYISKNGTDSDYCGRNLSDPCKTLDKLLTLVHHKSHPSTNSTPFGIVTDFSLLLNRIIMVRYLLCYLLHLVCKLPFALCRKFTQF